MSGFGVVRVFVDANVLYSRTLRDWLFLMALETSPPPYGVYWSEDVLAEVVHNLRKSYPDWDAAQTGRIRQLLMRSFEGGLVDDFVVDGSFTGSDAADAHVHAAATRCHASFLLTSNVRDFDPDSEGLPYEVITPDDFFVLVDDTVPTLVRAVTVSQMDYWAKRRPEARLPHYLRKAGCENFAERVRRHQARIGGLPPGL
ncbi:PIN domain-containing protein [Arsenicicoccus piscis]|uniref:PIN domain-containing protein n=1 Tax=Arsenicicoccus piscis TaxID=673954 RepID=A0ABQ6HQX4_9MICO|nr:PIN domain-containing protein [Arsenicicoccus piscis]MCH8628552.1 PIN domain-containing protein [Arsenicicoccus piscis]GMA19864.1 PIN domain-containing protein [Arsenicicoccus piscis]